VHQRRGLCSISKEKNRAIIRALGRVDRAAPVRGVNVAGSNGHVSLAIEHGRLVLEEHAVAAAVWQGRPDYLLPSYAAHPDGCTIFVTARRDDARGTYTPSTPSTASGGGSGPGRCVSRAKATTTTTRWARGVGLRNDGYVCSCQVASPNVARNSAPDWNMGRERSCSGEADAGGAESHSATRTWATACFASWSAWFVMEWTPS
jgi:hypothetical protein